MKNINDYKFKTYFYLNTDGDFGYSTDYKTEILYTKTIERAIEIIEERLLLVIKTVRIPERKSYITEEVINLLERALEEFEYCKQGNYIQKNKAYYYERSNGNYDIEIEIEELTDNISDDQLID